MSWRFLMLLFLTAIAACYDHDQEFTFHRHLKLDGVSEIDETGTVKRINAPGHHTGQVLYSLPFEFKHPSTNSVSFSTTFVFSMNFRFPVMSRDGITFFISSKKPLPLATSSDYESTHIFSVVFSTRIKYTEGFIDTNDTLLEINEKDTTLISSSPLGFFSDMDGYLQKVDLAEGEPFQVWIEYDGIEKMLNVTLSPLSVPKPSRPLLSVAEDLTPRISKNMYIGISTCDQPNLSGHYITGWSFKVNGPAQEFDRSQLAMFNPLEESFIPLRNWKIIHVNCSCAHGAQATQNRLKGTNNIVK
ncbi:hypothetical protein K2173_015029 [Erythroxylum novogranatense]|uniref:Legume lectin domain-containing protein n=1 Tax=Erythroxylum novogranatense TaxID=1862640 RepID=A0AAV8TX46_9ROSI|nr:hypothetical protein K2173_015029 [Erythroxylum novogranatense]